MKARIDNKQGKGVERTEGYSNDENALRREFGIDPEMDRSEAAAGLGDTGRGHGWRRLQWYQGANLGVLHDVARLRDLAEAPSQFEETNQEEGNASISIL